MFLPLKLTRPQQHWLDFVIAMTEKEIKARYKYALLGFLWIVLNPLIQMLIIGVVFQFFVPLEVENYFLFLFAGLLPWNFFSYSVQKSTPAIVYERSLIQKAKFPKEAIIISIVLGNFFHFLIALFLLGMGLGVYSVFVEKVGLEGVSFFIFKLVLVIPALIWLLGLVVAVALILSALNVKYRDTNLVVQAFMPLVFYVTPVIYPLKVLPSSMWWLAYLNPMTAVTEYFQWIFLNEPPVMVNLWTVSVCMTLSLVVIGWHFFQSESAYFDDWL